MSHISEGNSEDSEAEDVELLLAPVAALGAPTPAMPRIQNHKRLAPQTPTRTKFLAHSRKYVISFSSTTKRRFVVFIPSAITTKWWQAGAGFYPVVEQLANEASRTLGDDEVEHMLSDYPCPFPIWRSFSQPKYICSRHSGKSMP